jgi:hypothetical protein
MCCCGAFLNCFIACQFGPQDTRFTGFYFFSFFLAIERGGDKVDTCLRLLRLHIGHGCTGTAARQRVMEHRLRLGAPTSSLFSYQIDF